MLNQQLDNKQREFHELQSMADTQDGDIERLVELKQKVNMLAGWLSEASGSILPIGLLPQ